MSTELDKLKDAFAAEGQPLPNEASRDASTAAAMKAFAEENETDVQGSSEPVRLTSTDNSMFKKLFRRRSMNLNLPNLKPIMLGGASLTVLSVAIFNTQYQQQKLPLPLEPGIAEINAVAPPVSEDAQTLERPKLKSDLAETAPIGSLPSLMLKVVQVPRLLVVKSELVMLAKTARSSVRASQGSVISRRSAKMGWRQ